jgi:hypothetical protein
VEALLKPDPPNVEKQQAIIALSINRLHATHWNVGILESWNVGS